MSELEVLLCKIYEDNILGKLSDSRYATLDAQYEKEQSELTAEISALEKAVKSYEKHEKDADRFIALIDKYENFDKLTIAMLNEFIISWADMYDSASMESKKMIVSCLIQRVEVYRDYRLHIDFNIDFEQFSAGLDISTIAA